MQSKFDGKCKVCTKTWKAGTEIHKVDDRWCSDEYCGNSSPSTVVATISMNKDEQVKTIVQRAREASRTFTMELVDSGKCKQEDIFATQKEVFVGFVIAYSMVK